jgi:GR25 family glycosyltransferase involved in LPS biosynthesis
METELKTRLTIGEVIKNTIYINLDYRVDRRKLFEKQVNDLHTAYPEDFTFQNVQRFSAIKDTENGLLGCGKSHAECLRIAIAKKWDYVFICEDDAEFIHPEILVNQLNIFLN